MPNRTEFAEALGRAVAAGLIAAENAGIFGPSTTPKHPRAQAANKPRRPRQQPSKTDPPPPARDLHETVDAALERQRREAAYSLDRADDEDVTPEEQARLERMFAATAETRELDGRALLTLERKLRVTPRPEDNNAGTYLPDQAEDLTAHVMVQGKVK